jgi:N-acyl-L-homoserine lactone synthetase
METLQSDLYFKTVSKESELRDCYRLRFQVYCKEKHWLSEANFPEELEIDEYDAKAIHVVAMDENFNIVGKVRNLREKDFKKLPFYDHPGFKGKRPDIPDASEISRLIITATKDRNIVIKGLIRLLYQTNRKIGVQNCVFVSEPSLLRFLERLKYYFEPICTPAMYFGGFTLAGCCNLDRMEARWRQTEKEAWQFNTSESSMILADKDLVRV